MTLYVPAAFSSEDREQALALVVAHPFATLVTSVDGGSPQISHLPMLIEQETLTGHLARANPHWTLLPEGHSVAIFHGPHAYVSPRGYTQPQLRVPTWNYATVHIEGRAQLLDDDASAALLERLTAHFERGSGYATDPAQLHTLLAGIVAFRMPIDRCVAKFKMSQNHSAEDRLGVMRTLRAAGSRDDLAVADWMQAHERAD